MGYELVVSIASRVSFGRESFSYDLDSGLEDQALHEIAESQLRCRFTIRIKG